MFDPANYYKKDAETPEWASFAIVRYVVNPDNNSIEENQYFVTKTPTTVSMGLHKDYGLEDMDKMEETYRSFHGTSLWLKRKGLLPDVDIPEDFDIWLDDLAGMLVVVLELPQLVLDEADNPMFNADGRLIYSPPKLLALEESGQE